MKTSRASLLAILIVCKIQAIAYALWDMHAWRREASNILQYVGRNRKKTLKDIVQAMAELVTLAEENFDIQKVLIKPRKADYESEERKRVLKGKYSSAKEKNLRSIPDLISARHDEENILGAFKRAWRNRKVQSNKNNDAGCWNFKTLKVA